MNINEIRTDVRTFLRESTAGFWSNANLNTCIKRAIREANRAALSGLLVERTGTFTTVSDTDVYDLPWYVKSIYTMRDTTNNVRLVVVRPAIYDDKIIDDSGTNSKPTHAFVWQYDITREPTSSTNTADSGTNTTTLVDSVLTSTTDDYYNNWLLINTNRTAWARVSDYVGSTKTLTLDRAIASQTTGDTYFLQKNLRRITMHPTPDGAYTIAYRYWVRLSDLTNDYDVPYVDEDYSDMIVDGAVAEALHIRNLYQLAGVPLQKFQAKLARYIRDQQDYIRDIIDTIEDGYEEVNGLPTYK